MFEQATSLSTWLTPTVLFLLLNLMIFSIAFTSGGFSSHHHSDASLLHHHLHQPPQLQPQLSRSLSILHRLKSLNFYNFIPSPQQLQLQLHHHDSLPETTADETENRLTPAAEDASVEEEEQDVHNLTPAAEEEEASVEEEEEDVHNNLTQAAEEEEEALGDEEGPTMDEVYSRIIQSNGNSYAYYGRQNSDTKPTGGEVPVRLPRKMKKSASDKSAFNHFGAAAVVEEERENAVDARADNFINKFRQQLKMQRLNSILRYKEIISKASAK